MRVLVTGASGWIGSAVVPELLEAGHQVVGLARSDASAAALTAVGVDVLRGSLDDLDALRDGAAASDGVLHLAFKHEEAFSGAFAEAAAADRLAIETLGAALAGTDRPLVIASGLAGHASGALVTEDDAADLGSTVSERMKAEQITVGLADRGVRSASVRLAPTVHGAGDGGFVATLTQIAREKGVAGYVGEGANHWPAVHQLDAARLFRLALEDGAAGSIFHGAAEEGVPMRAIAEAIGRGLGVPAASIAPEDAAEHFGWVAAFVTLDVRASSALTRERLGWAPTHAGLIEDLDAGHYTG